jgi:hypothetical protein
VRYRLRSENVRDKKKIDSEFVKDNWINKRFILSVLSSFFDWGNSESIFFPTLRDENLGFADKNRLLI